MNALSLSNERPICIAVLAIGGQGGGVLTDWIVAVAEANGWHAQMTSVPGVAQRTGATVYYVEVMPDTGRKPVLALMPTPGEVDIVLAMEFMEAGRAVMRGFCMPDRTTLICSTHRDYAISEKMRPGNGVLDPKPVIAAVRASNARVIAFDMADIAKREGSVISSTMLGALAASSALPFPRASYEAAIKHGGVGVKESLNAFARAYDNAGTGADGLAELEKPAVATLPPTIKHPGFAAVVATALQRFPAPTHELLSAGMRRLADYQDLRYVEQYLQLLTRMLELDQAAGGQNRGFALTTEAARQIAVAMAYDDVIRVADLKIRSARVDRIRKEVGVNTNQIVYTTEFMHPRMDEVAGTLPRWLGAWLTAHPAVFNKLDKLINKGRRVQTGKLSGFFMLFMVASMRRFRRSTLRHHQEAQHLEQWLTQVHATVSQNYDLAVELLKNRRLVKGYSDTHARGNSKFERVMQAARQLAGKADAAEQVRKLREAALMDEAGTALDAALQEIHS